MLPQVGRLQEGFAIGVAVFQGARFFVALGDRLFDGGLVGRDVGRVQHILQQDMALPLILRHLVVRQRILFVKHHEKILNSFEMWLQPQ